MFYYAVSRTLTTRPNENTSDGLLSSPLKCASGLRQLSFPASILDAPAVRQVRCVFQVGELDVLNDNPLVTLLAVDHYVVGLDICLISARDQAKYISVMPTQVDDISVVEVSDCFDAGFEDPPAVLHREPLSDKLQEVGGHEVVNERASIRNPVNW